MYRWYLRCPVHFLIEGEGRIRYVRKATWRVVSHVPT
jgi:hypothetical protein